MECWSLTEERVTQWARQSILRNVLLVPNFLSAQVASALLIEVQYIQSVRFPQQVHTLCLHLSFASTRSITKVMCSCGYVQLNTSSAKV